MATLRWGILGCGNIARQFADSLPTAQRGVIAAVGSRSIDTARGFVAQRAAGAAAGSYEQTITRPDVDAVYISLPNSLHHQWTMEALAAGKHVLCEKPIAASAAEASEMFDRAEKKGLLLMEAFMYRCHPLTHAVVEAVRSGAIGRVKLIRTSFCFRVRNTEGNIRFSRDLAGGVLMDVGCYCINFSRLMAGAASLPLTPSPGTPDFGELSRAGEGSGEGKRQSENGVNVANPPLFSSLPPPTSAEPLDMAITAALHANGVDEMAAGLLRFPHGIAATFTCAMTAQADNTAMICGDEGFIEIPIPWKPPAQNAAWVLAHSTPPKMEFAGGNAPAPKPRQTFTVNAGKGLFALEADDFAQSVLDGAPPRISRQDSLGNMLVLDQLRKRIGVL